MTREFLKNLGLEDAAIDKILDENMQDIGKEKAKTNTAQTELSTEKEKLSTALGELETLKKSNGDVATVQKQLEDLQAKYDADIADRDAKLADRDYSDAVARTIAGKGIKFSSKAAEKAYTADLKAKNLAIKDGVLDGFDDFHKAQLEADPTAFQTDKPAPTFVKHIGPGGPPANESKGAMYAKQFNAKYAPTKAKE